MDRADDEDFRGFMASRAPALLRTAYLLTGDRGRAEDLVQTALARAYRHWGRVRSTGNPEAYVRRILLNEQHRWWRRGGDRETAVGELPERGVPDGAAAVDERDALWRAGGAFSGGGAAALPGGAIITQVSVCGPTRVVVVAPPGSTGRVSWVTAVAADLTITEPTEDMPLRPDGVAVFDRPAPDRTITLRVDKDGENVADTWFGYETGPGPKGLPAGAVERAIAAAPGDGDPARALEILRQQFTQVPVDQADVQVLWTGTTRSGWTVAAAVTTLPGGARYVWGGAVSDSDASKGIRYFDGLLAADRFDRTALVFRFPGSLAVLFSGTREVRIEPGDGTGVQTVTGGMIDENGGDGTGVRVLDEDRRELRIVDATQLPELPSPRG